MGWAWTGHPNKACPHGDHTADTQLSFQRLWKLHKRATFQKIKKFKILPSDPHHWSQWAYMGFRTRANAPSLGQVQ